MDDAIEVVIWDAIEDAMDDAIEYAIKDAMENAKVIRNRRGYYLISIRFVLSKIE